MSNDLKYIDISKMSAYQGFKENEKCLQTEKVGHIQRTKTHSNINNTGYY